MELLGLAVSGVTEAFDRFNQTVLPRLGGDGAVSDDGEGIPLTIQEDTELIILVAILHQARGGEVPFNETVVWFRGAVYGGFEPRVANNTHLLGECFILGPHKTVEELNKNRNITENK